MSAISTFLQTIRTAIYGEQVRGAIADAIEQCYDDVSNPSLQTEAFKTAIEEEYESGILDIITVTQISAMTNQNIIYRYNGTETGRPKGLYYYNGTDWKLIGSGVQVAGSASAMTDTNAIYKYTGSETGYTTNALYYYDGTAWKLILSGTISLDVFNATTNGLVPATGSGKASKGYFLSGKGTFEAIPFNEIACKNLINILRHVAYSEDMSEQISTLALALNVRESSDDDGDVLADYTYGQHFDKGTAQRVAPQTDFTGANKFVFIIKVDEDFGAGNLIALNAPAGSLSASIGIAANGTISNPDTDFGRVPLSVAQLVDEAGKLTLTWKNPSGYTSRSYFTRYQLIFNGYNPSIGFTLYGIKGYKDGTLTLDLEATSTAGVFYDNVSASSVTFGSATGIQVVEVEQ